MRRFAWGTLGRKLEELLALDPTLQPRLIIYTAADDATYHHRTIIGAFPLPFNGRRVTIVTDGPEGIKEFTWTSERRLARPGETPLSALEDGT